MSKNLSTSIFTKSYDASNQDSLWEQAISDAQELRKQAQARAAELKRSIEILKSLRERGAKFPGSGRMVS